jgi:LysM repeat protein
VAGTSSGTYTVQPGDTLSSIAAKQGISGGWSALWGMNRNAVADPNLILVGQALAV